MRFANIIFDGNREGSYNLGDDLQLMAINHLYKEMGIHKNSILRIGMSELSYYSGEYAILPVSFPLYGYREENFITMFSPKIIPVFLSLSIMTHNISEAECVYLRRFEPVGCRDYHTMKIMREHNIMSYLNGCMTVTLPRTATGRGTKVYLVDIPQQYLAYIPEHLRSNAIVKSQVRVSCDNAEQEMQELLDEYANHAALVITSRLHCALPCIAMGVPVVFMKDKYSFRFPTLSRYVHPYEKGEFNKIDWNPAAIEYEEQKREIIASAIQQIQNAYSKYAAIFNISSYYERNNIREDYHIEHVDNVIEDIREIFQKHPGLHYGIWGITQKADMICDFIEESYPGARLTVVYDRQKRISFHSVTSTNSKKDLLEKAEYVFVTAATANAPAKDFFETNHYCNYHISTDSIGE